MRIYRTTCYQVSNPDLIDWVRYGTNKIRYAAAGTTSWHGKRRRVTLEMIEVPEDSWVRVADTEEGNS